MRTIPLGRPVERAVLYRMALGKAPLDAVRPDELSKQGQMVLSSLARLSKAGQLPANPSTLALMMSELHGALPAEARSYTQKLWSEGRESQDADPQAVLQAVRERRLATEITDKIWEMVREDGTLDTPALVALLTRERAAGSLEAAAIAMRKGVPPEVSGPPVKSLPRISRAMGGVHGRIVLGGLPNVGKSPLAWQIALEYAAYGKRPVLWYDLDDTGVAALQRRTFEIFLKNQKRAARALESVYIRDTIKTLDADMGTAPGSLIVIDSLQKLPAGQAKDRRHALDNWLARFPGIGKAGHPMILISEVSRANYREARQSSFKETGEIEYAGTFCAQMIPEDEGDSDEPTQFHVVKNRHRRKITGTTYGHVVNLTVDPKREWWAIENEPADDEPEEDTLA